MVSSVKNLVICSFTESKIKGGSPAPDPCISAACLNILLLGLHPSIIKETAIPPLLKKEQHEIPNFFYSQKGLQTTSSQKEYFKIFPLGL